MTRPLALWQCFAQSCSSRRSVHREVRVVLEGADKSGNLLGNIMYPHQQEAHELGFHLVEAGLAKVCCSIPPPSSSWQQDRLHAWPRPCGGAWGHNPVLLHSARC